MLNGPSINLVESPIFMRSIRKRLEGLQENVRICAFKSKTPRAIVSELKQAFLDQMPKQQREIMRNLKLF